MFSSVFCWFETISNYVYFGKVYTYTSCSKYINLVPRSRYIRVLYFTTFQIKFSMYRLLSKRYNTHGNL